jgi:hypothetical protein
MFTYIENTSSNSPMLINNMVGLRNPWEMEGIVSVTRNPVLDFAQIQTVRRPPANSVD